MLTAQSAEGIVAASDLQHFDAARLEAIKPTLTCRLCGKPAHFRRKAVNGRSAHFYLTHAPGCEETGVAETETVGGALAPVPAIWNEGDVLQLRRDSPRPTNHVVPAADASELDGTGSRGRHHVSGDNDGEARRRTIGYSVLLHRLRDEPGFANSSTPLGMSDGSTTTVRDACSPAGQFRRRDRGEQVLWGVVMSSSRSGRNMWINTGQRGTALPAVLVRGAHVDEVLAAAGATSPEQLNGRWFLVEGVFGVTKTGTPYCTLEVPAALYVAAR